MNKYDPVEPTFLTARQCAERAQISVKWLRELISKGYGPPFCRFGRHIRIRAEDFENWAVHGTKTSRGTRWSPTGVQRKPNGQFDAKRSPI